MKFPNDEFAWFWKDASPDTSTGEFAWSWKEMFVLFGAAR